MTWSPTSVTRGEWARLQVLVNGKDVTFFRNVRTTVESWAGAEPFGATTCVIVFPQISPLEVLGVGALSWFRYGCNVDIRGIRPDGSKFVVWEGILGSNEDSMEESASGGLRIECLGALYQADLVLKQPAVYSPDAIDIGYAIADALNSVASRRYGPVQRVTTGIMTRSRGSWDPLLTGYIGDLLGTAVDSSDRQWTVRLDDNRKPVIALKNTTTVNWTVRAGQPGVSFSLRADFTMHPNRIYGDGTAPGGCHWRNTKYPNLRADSAPAYPYSSASTIMTIGSTDAGTLSGRGVTDWRNEMRQDGYTVGSSGPFNSTDAAAARRLQTHAGLTVDGTVGPQTWAVTFDIGQNGGSLYGSYFAPLAAKHYTEKYRRSATGAVLGPYGSYVPEVVHVERYETMGEGITKAEGVVSAENEIHRIYPADSTEPWPPLPYTGTITFRIDPAEGSRFDIRQGHNIKLQGHRGVDRVLHVAHYEINLDAMSVTCTVDERGRDWVTVAQIIERNRESTNPTRSNRRTRSAARLVQDRVTWDCEAGGGIIPRFALGAGLWSVIRVPAAESGSIVKTVLTTTGPASKFAAGFFTGPVTPADLLRYVGDPLSNASNAKPWSTSADTLTDLGLVIAWGGPQQAAGYYPGVQTDASGASSDPITGRLVDMQPWYYQSDYPPWLWFAVYSPTACFISGQLSQGVQ